MLSVPLINQRNFPQKLGFSNVTIADYGCVLSCLTALSGRTDVAAVNELFKQKTIELNKQGQDGPFVQQNLVYWVKVPLALPNLKFVWRGWTYENDKVKDWIAKGFPVVVEVDAAPIGAPRSSHFVIYIGDQKCMDPWTGRIRPTSDFPDVKGYVLYEVAKKPQTDAEKIAAIKQVLSSTAVADKQINDIKAIVY